MALSLEALFNPEYYLALYPDVRQAIATGFVKTAREHFELYGKFESRQAGPLFDTNYYLRLYPDVQQAIATGFVESAIDHYTKYGAREQRFASLLFNANYYLALYPDVQQAIATGFVESAIEHFVKYGEQENRSPFAGFNANDYLRRYPDVQQAIATGFVKSAFAHFALYGQSESRFGVNNAPVATEDSLLFSSNAPVTIDVLANDRDPNGDLLSITGISGATGGTVVINSDGTLTYTADPGASSHSFFYTVADQYGAVSNAKVNLADVVIINPVPYTTENPTPAADDRFGWAVAGQGTAFVVGAPNDHLAGGTPGAAYLFDRNTGALLRRIDNPTAANNDQFGFSTTVLSNGTVVVGAPLDDAGGADAGAVHFFNSTTGTLIRTVNNPNPAEGGEFGHALAALGTSVVVGIPEEEVNNVTNAGAVVVVDSTSGTITRTINNPNPGPNADDRFGWAVATSDSNIFIGAPGEDALGVDAGAVYRYDGNTVTLFNNPNPQPFNFQFLNTTVAQVGDGFGFAIAASTNRVLIGAPGENAGRGAAYLYDTITGNLLHTFQSPTGSVGYSFNYDTGFGFSVPVTGIKAFGFSVGLLGNDVLIGAPLDAQGNGAVHRFNAETGQFLETISNPTETTGFSFELQFGSRTVTLSDIQGFGFSVATLGNDLLIGEPGDSSGTGVTHLNTNL